MIRFCSLYSGSSGNSVLLFTDTTKLLIDAGLSAKKITGALGSIGINPSELSAVLISHEHSDHIRGAGIISRKFDIPVYANECTWNAMEKDLGPIDTKNKAYFNTGTEFVIGDVCISTFAIPHDAAEPVGFNLYTGDKKITVATDIGHMTKTLLRYMEQSDLLLLECNHDIEMLRIGKYPWHLKQRILGDRGHLCNEIAGKVIAYLAEKGTKKFLLGHLSKENNFPELAYQTVHNALNEKKFSIGNDAETDVFVEVALRDKVGRIIEL